MNSCLKEDEPPESVSFDYLTNCNHLLALRMNRNHLLNDKAELCNCLKKNVPWSA